VARQVNHLQRGREAHLSRLGAGGHHAARAPHRQVLALLQLDGLGQDEVLLGRAVAQLGARQGHGHLGTRERKAGGSMGSRGEEDTRRCAR